jgi:hypothetical protein
MKIIFNADDFGITDAVSAAIVELFARGTPLKSTTVMINLISGRSAALLKDFLGGADAGKFSIGLHFNLTCGRPVLPAGDIDSLTGPDGSLLKFGELVERAGRNELSSSHIAAEFEAQIGAFRDKLGFYPSHADSHKHVHMLPQVFEIVSRGLEKHKIKAVRLTENISADELFTSQGVTPEKTARCFEGRLAKTGCFYSYAASTALSYARMFLGTYSVGSLGAETFEKEISGYAGSDSLCEYMTHPGLCDDELKKLSSLLAPRESEFKALKDPRLTEILKKYNIEPVSFHDLK